MRDESLSSICVLKLRAIGYLERLKRQKGRIAQSPFTIAAVVAIYAFAATLSFAESRVVIISLDGATPGLVKEFINDGTIPSDRGFGLLVSKGTTALRNATANPSLTAPSHIAIATGSTAASNDVM